MKNKIAILSLLIAAASILFTIENMIPSPLPWFRLGLSNIVTLLVLKWWGLKDSLIVVILRVFLGGLLSGKLFSPLFIISLSGGITSALGMGIVMLYRNKFFSLIGISIIGASIKNIFQLFTAYLLFIRNMSIFSLIPMFMLISLITGTIIGIAVHVIDKKLYAGIDNHEIPK
ncbi:MAG: Gx transporter family protein [bacterium]